MRSWILWLVFVALIAVIVSCSGAVWTTSRYGYNRYDTVIYDPFYYSDCPRHWTYGPLDCYRCHW